MKILFISDLHLGSPLFKEEKDIMKLLNDPSYHKIVIVGDLFDNWEDCKCYILKKYKNLIAKINSMENVIIINGNHDYSTREMNNIFPNKTIHKEYRVDEDTIAVHGEEFDNNVHKHKWFWKYVAFPFHWIAESYGINLKYWLRETVHDMRLVRDDIPYDSLVFQAEKKLVGKYLTKYKNIVCGHTHLPKIVHDQYFTFVNCGDWLSNDTYVEYENGAFKIVRS